ncbi:MAG: fluoride efflux transporter CrcB [Alphaproteobacteria bacterium]|nr:fluoride efflux transporter CrcB [Alphaproteobacteria bacterium]
MAAAVGLGGAVGALMRYAVGRAFAGAGFAAPFATLFVNIVGSFIMGLIVGWILVRGEISTEIRALLSIGMLGSFTTFSTYSVDALVLSRDKGIQWAVAYAGGSVILSIAAVAFGYWLAASFFQRGP